MSASLFGPNNLLDATFVHVEGDTMQGPLTLVDQSEAASMAYVQTVLDRLESLVVLRDGSHGLTGDLDAGNHRITIGNITVLGTVEGTVEGVDVGALQIDLDGFPDELKVLTTGEIQQVANIGAVTVNAAQWGYVGGSDQGTAQADSPTFAGATINGDIGVTGTVDTVDVAALEANVAGYDPELKALTAVEIQQLQTIGAVTITGAQWGYLGGSDQGTAQADSPTFGGATINGDIGVTGTVDTVDVAALAANVAGYDPELKALTAVEIQQLQNIGTTVIPAGTWAALTGLNNYFDTANVVRLCITKTGIVDNVATAVFKITTTNETGDFDGGHYVCKVFGVVGWYPYEIYAQMACLSFSAHFAALTIKTGLTSVQSAVTEISETADASTGAFITIDAVAMTVVANGCYENQIKFQIDAGGGGAADNEGFVRLLVEVVHAGYLTPPVIAAM